MIYEYYCLDEKCDDYKKVFKVKQSMKDKALKKCECCRNDTLQKVLYAPNFKLYGIGVYKNGTN